MLRPPVDSASRPVALALGGLVALAAAMGVGRFVYTPILPVMAETLGLSKAQAGLIASANFLGYLIGALLAATPHLRGNRRTWLLGALAVSTVTTAAMGLTTSMPAFLILRATGGAASAFVLVLASALVLDRLAAAGRTGLFALHFGGVGAGIAVSALVVSVLQAFGEDWSVLWYAVGGLSLAATAAVAWLIPPADPPHAGGAGSIADAAPRRGLPALVCAYGLFGFGYVITATFLVAIVRASPPLRSVEPLVWLIVGLTAAPSVALWARASLRLGIPRTFSIACVVEAVGVAASVLWPSVTGALLAAALLGGTFMGLTALGLSGARRLAPANPRPVLAMMTASFGFGQIAGPVLAGLLSEHTGSFALPSLLAAGALLVAAVLVSPVPAASLL
nr:YbfB/YjiJ family MFS transporter [uncultured Rhodopila sp.]